MCVDPYTGDVHCSVCGEIIYNVPPLPLTSEAELEGESFAEDYYNSAAIRKKFCVKKRQESNFVGSGFTCMVVHGVRCYPKDEVDKIAAYGVKKGRKKAWYFEGHLYVSTEVVAEEKGISRREANKRVKAGEIPGRRVGNQWFIPEAVLKYPKSASD